MRGTCPTKQKVPHNRGQGDKEACWKDRSTVYMQRVAGEKNSGIDMTKDNDKTLNMIFVNQTNKSNPGQGKSCGVQLENTC